MNFLNWYLTTLPLDLTQWYAYPLHFGWAIITL